MAVLQRDIEVGAEARLLPHQAQQLAVEGRRVGVEEADPGDVGVGEQRLDEVQQAMSPFTEVLAEARGVLGDEAELLDPGGLELPRLEHQAVDGAAAKAAPPHRDGAEGTRVVAAFGHLEVGVAAGGEQPRRGVVEHQVRGRRQRRPAAELHHLLHLAQLVEADEAVDLGDLALQLLAVAVDHAPGHQQPLAAACLAGRHLEDGVDRLPAGILDEAAGVDDGVSAEVGVAGDLVALARSSPSITSLSTRFFAQPREIIPTRPLGRLGERHGAEVSKFSEVTLAPGGGVASPHAMERRLQSRRVTPCRRPLEQEPHADSQPSSAAAPIAVLSMHRRASFAAT